MPSGSSSLHSCQHLTPASSFISDFSPPSSSFLVTSPDQLANQSLGAAWLKQRRNTSVRGAEKVMPWQRPFFFFFFFAFNTTESCPFSEERRMFACLANISDKGKA